MSPGQSRVAAILALTAAGCALAAAPAQSATPLRVSVLTTEQRELLKAPELRLRVTAARPGTVELKLTTSVGMETASIAPAERVAFAEAGTKTVTVKLSEVGGTLLTGCSTAGRIRVGATLRRGERTARATAFRTLRGAPELCPPPAPLPGYPPAS
ncbi:MAG TPA: hypothetical protein VN238_21340 [Solirubrobacteraceae bacterium]|nr:hypothetical protein [Solirubrobacteraceae bacterium]